MVGLGGNIDWYCRGDMGWWDTLVGCVPSAEDQARMMRGNFGRASDPVLVDKSVSDFSQYLQSSGYDSTVSDLKCQGSLFCNIPWGTIGLVTIAVVGMTVVFGDSGARRYGR